MTSLGRIVLIMLVLLGVLCVIVGAVLRHYIGGFFETVAREERKQSEQYEAERLARITEKESKQEKTDKTGEES